VFCDLRLTIADLRFVVSFEQALLSIIPSMNFPPYFFKGPRRDRGFTLIELMVAIGVAAILAAIAIPAFNSFVMNDRDASQINSLVGSFNYARSMAVKLNSRNGVQVCPSAGGTACDAPAAGWSAGWVVLDVNNPAPPLQSVPALAGANNIYPTGGGANVITFKSNGTVDFPVQIKICDARLGAFARDVEVSPVGAITSSPKPGQSATGGVLTCP
jgi:type IV fimbrial biogenesis protein FimT